MILDELGKHKKILIFGYGIEGKSAERLIKLKFPQVEIGIADQKDGPNYLAEQEDYDLAIKSPGVNRKLVTIPYTTPTNLFFANAKAPIVGITGTKGKSTTTSLIYAMLKAGGYDARLAGNIGKPMLDELLGPVNPKTIYVLELSSYQLDDMEHSPHISVILNLFPEHLDYHGGFENYKIAKLNIIRFAKNSDYFVFNPDFNDLKKAAKDIKAKAVPMVKELPFKRDAIPLIGEHNVLNVKIAYTAAKILGVSDSDIEQAVRQFIPLPHRLEFVGNFKGIDFYDDAISTTPESTIQAIHSIENIKTIFLGGQDRGYKFSELAEVIVGKGIPNIVLFPDSGSHIKDELRVKCQMSNVRCNFLETKDMKEAVKFAYKNTPRGAVALLSCASPSYSVWKNFEEKGDLFKKFVVEFGKQ